jgi:glucokinase
MQTAVQANPQADPQADPNIGPNARAVLTKALLNAGTGLGISRERLGEVIGRDRAAFSRGYRSLYALVGGDPAEMRHWMHTPNRDTGGVPAEQLRSVQGLVSVVEYLDAMRGHG